MLAHYTIKDLYTLALAEGEGMGTAYEYYAKRLALGRWLKARPRPTSILLAGLPEKYGASLDFLLLAGELGATVTVVDDRPAALARLRQALATSETSEVWAALAQPAAIILADLPSLATLSGRFDLAMSSEVLQRLGTAERPTYVAALRARADALALFAPNADNPAHTDRSGLAGLRLAELRTLLGDDPSLLSTANCQLTTGYIDMPPFPPGITRSDAQREQATQGAFEAAVMSGLRLYAHGERYLPGALRRRQSHIVYALAGG
jgi:DNA-binding NarL/FixJ family response regulator